MLQFNKKFGAYFTTNPTAKPIAVLVAGVLPWQMPSTYFLSKATMCCFLSVGRASIKVFS